MNPTEVLPDLNHAFTLSERISSYRTSGDENGNGSLSFTERGKARLSRWKALTPFKDGDGFSRRLADLNVTQDEFLHLLSAPPHRIEEAADWPSGLREALTDYSNQFPGPAPVRREHSGLFEPFLRHAERRLEEGIAEIGSRHPATPFEAGLAATLFMNHLPPLLDRIAQRTLVLELNVARVRGELTGDTAEERFRDFVNRLREPATIIRILDEYPVLARQLWVRLSHWLRFSLEFLEHLCTDWDRIVATLSPAGDPGTLTAVMGGAGDSHRGGRAVMIAGFSSGFRVVYKPRAFDLDQQFARLLEWFNVRNPEFQFRLAKTVNSGGHGWMEFVEAEPCATNEEAKLFYRRLGGQLSLLYLLDATDFHFENIIAAGQHPVLIDLEALFQPDIPAASGNDDPFLFSQETMFRTVIRPGLLPWKVWGTGKENKGLDMSGIGGAEGQVIPFRVLKPEMAGTDRMKMTRQTARLGGSKNRPTLNGEALNATEFTGDMVGGFTTIHRLMFKHREELAAAEGPVAAFGDKEVRVLFRPTRVYFTILEESFHHTMLRDSTDRDCFLDRIWLGADRRPVFLNLIPSELRDLNNNDIPVFSARPDSTDIFDSEGRTIPGLLSEPPMKRVLDRIRTEGEEELETHLWTIRCTVAASDGSLTGTDGSVKRPVYGHREAPDSVRPATRDELIQAACGIADRIEGKASHKNDWISWLVLTSSHPNSFGVAPADSTLYDGLTGIALFFAYLSELTGRERYRAVAQKCLNTCLDYERKVSEFVTGETRMIGAFGGDAGLIYLLTHLGRLWDDPSLYNVAEGLAAGLNQAIERDEMFDWISGAAGYSAVLNTLAAVSGSQVAKEGVNRCALHLAAHARESAAGSAWPAQWAGNVALLGLGHGSSGIALALIRAATLTGERFPMDLARQAIRYERSLFDPVARDWPDLRHDRDGSPPPMAWCYGAPGIGLARLATLREYDDSEVRDEIAAALQRTRAQGFGRSHCLCHGDLGNAGLLIRAATELGTDGALQEARRWAADCIASPWHFGTPYGLETQGLLTGAAGIGYGLLRAADAGAVPDVLTLEPPASPQARRRRP